MKKLLLILLCLPFIGFGQKIEEKIDDFTDVKLFSLLLRYNK